MQKFRALGAPPPDPVPPAAGGFAPIPPNSPPHYEFLATRACPGVLKPEEGWGIYYPNNLRMVYSTSASPKKIWLCVHLSAGLHLNSGKTSVPFLVKTFYFWSSPELEEKSVAFKWRLCFFFALHLICSPEQNRGRGSSPPMLKIEQNWGNIANYPPQCSTKICTPIFATSGIAKTSAWNTVLCIPTWKKCLFWGVVWVFCIKTRTYSPFSFEPSV